jgi:hypothetical protein
MKDFLLFFESLVYSPVKLPFKFLLLGDGVLCLIDFVDFRLGLTHRCQHHSVNRVLPRSTNSNRRLRFQYSQRQSISGVIPTAALPQLCLCSDDHLPFVRNSLRNVNVARQLAKKRESELLFPAHPTDRPTSPFLFYYAPSNFIHQRRGESDRSKCSMTVCSVHLQ